MCLLYFFTDLIKSHPFHPSIFTYLDYCHFQGFFSFWNFLISLLMVDLFTENISANLFCFPPRRYKSTANCLCSNDISCRLLSIFLSTTQKRDNSYKVNWQIISLKLCPTHAKFSRYIILAEIEVYCENISI